MFEFTRNDKRLLATPREVLGICRWEVEEVEENVLALIPLYLAAAGTEVEDFLGRSWMGGSVVMEVQNHGNRLRPIYFPVIPADNIKVWSGGKLSQFFRGDNYLTTNTCLDDVIKITYDVTPSDPPDAVRLAVSKIAALHLQSGSNPVKGAIRTVESLVAAYRRYPPIAA